MTRQKSRPPKRQDKDNLKGRILKLIKARALDKVEISKALDLPAEKRGELRELLRRMEIDGDVARIRKDRYIIPQAADLFTGIIQFHASGTAHVLSEKPGAPDLFVSAENTSTAMHGDKVVARLQSGNDDRGPRRGGRAPEARKEGRVIRILDRANDIIVGTLQQTRNFLYVVADDPRFVHNLYVPIPKPPLKASAGDKVVARLESWPSRHANPEGQIVEVLGRADQPGVDMLSIIRKHRLPERFPEEVQREAEAISPQISRDEIRRREDLREQFIITIDPDDARDFDDAIQVERTAKGWRVGIHIADVAHYVTPKSPLDREAYARGNSVYLADRVIPMLPEALSNGICSLRPNEDRLVFSCFAEVSTAGKVISSRFGRSVICSKARLTYKEAFALLKKPAKDELGERLHTAWELSSLLRKKRFEGGSLDMDFPEVKVWLDEQGRPVRLEKIENDISHQLIEELMLLANETVARHLKRNRQPAVYRVHEKPDPDKLAELREVVATYGVKCGDLTNRAEIQKVLTSARGKHHEYGIKLALLKSLKRARYAPEPLGHYGLNKGDYTHFTSPIRRYSDLIVHRALAKQIGISKFGPDSSTLVEASDHISITERVAADAEKESSRLKKLEFFQIQVSERKGGVFRATILDVRNYGLLVELPDCLMTGLIHVSELEGDFYILDAARGRLVGRKTRKSYQVGQELDVIVSRVDVFKQQVDFRPA